jgi:hypothetical protein
VNIALVYQAGIANVFRVNEFHLDASERTAHRLFQGDFRGAVCFVEGAASAGANVKTAHCNLAGDIASASWSPDLDDAPFSDMLVQVDSSALPWIR